MQKQKNAMSNIFFSNNHTNVEYQCIKCCYPNLHRNVYIKLCDTLGIKELDPFLFYYNSNFTSYAMEFQAQTQDFEKERVHTLSTEGQRVSTGSQTVGASSTGAGQG